MTKVHAARLTGRQTECLALYYFDGLSQSEIGDELTIGQRTVSQHLTYGRRKLAAVDLEPRRVEYDAPLRITHMDIDSLDNLAAALIRCVW